MDTRVRKRYVSAVRSVGGSRADVFVAPGQCNVRPRCRSLSAFQRWTCVDDVVGAVDHVCAELRGRWGVVRGRGSVLTAPFFSTTFLLYSSTRGRIRSAPECRSSHVAILTDRYDNAYPCTESSGGRLHRRAACRRVPQVAKVSPRVLCRFLSAHWFPPS